tara:strand:+ start:765 stop:1001 length:237 start_codon:yes stop_codon:yes gene_type:complete
MKYKVIDMDGKEVETIQPVAPCKKCGLIVYQSNLSSVGWCPSDSGLLDNQDHFWKPKEEEEIHNLNNNDSLEIKPQVP